MNLIAKPIVKNQWWIVTDGTNKVGNVEFSGGQYNLKIGNQETKYHSTKEIQQFIAIEFQRPKVDRKQFLPYAQWPTGGKTYNNVFDIKRKLHVFTKSKKSKCYFAAGWFLMKLNGVWSTIFCPKYILIQRYEWIGPFMSMESAVLNNPEKDV